MNERPSSILVYVGLDAIGDGLMKLPFVHALRAAFPDARITWLAGKGPSVYVKALAPLVAGLLDEVVDNAGIGSRVGELFGHRPLADRSFDLIIDTQRRTLTTLILRRIRHQRFLSGAGRFLFSDSRPEIRDKPRSMVRQLALLIELATGRPPVPMGPLPRDPATDRVAETLLPDGRPYVGFVPGAGMAKKCWPLERFVAVAKTQMAAGYIPVFLLGPAESELVGPVRDALPEARLPLQDAAEITPILTISLAHRLAAAVTNDCGTGHLLALADIPLVSLFGPTPPDKFSPATHKVEILQARTWGGEAMEMIPTDAVSEALSRLLSAATPPVAAGSSPPPISV